MHSNKLLTSVRVYQRCIHIFIFPTFKTKVTEYLCSGWVFFFRKILIFLEYKSFDARIIVPTFVTKITEYLCSCVFFFLQTNFDFLTSNFSLKKVFIYHLDFYISFKRYCYLELKFEKIFHM